MNEHRDDRPSAQEPSEYHIVRPEREWERERSAYSDAFYRTAPREGGTPYGYNPNRYYAGSDCGCHRGQVGIKTVLILCLVCVLAASLLGAGGVYFLSRDLRGQRARAEAAPESFFVTVSYLG